MMDESRWQKVETIIDEVLDLPPEKRNTYINIQCEGDAALKGEVTQLLESIFDSRGWLENPKQYKKEFYEEVSDDLESLSSHHSLIGKQVGAYSIQKQIGEGGMGAVYLAERADKEFQHSVAIKIIRHGRATTSNIQRFKREQQILADLNHPGIATLHDGGVTDDGFLYIIMEYVEGMPIDEYCRQQNISVDDKITLFKQVLHAVRHAHENLVIHRDLKPGNILVDQSGDIKILDFGISKLLEEKDTSLTQTGARLLTPKYAAPEQIKETNITTATDLYALGIIFYELLAGVPPFNFEDASQHEIEHIILQNDPSAPSSRVDTAKLEKAFRGDLDAIVLKAIRKEPELRYRVANDFLNDLENYRKGLPVTARQDSVQYRSKKFLQRHKQGVASIAAILLLIIGFAGFYTWRITEERDQARFEAQRAEEVKDFMLSIFNRSNPDMAAYSNDELSAAELLAEGLQKVEVELQNQPQMYIEMLVSIGDALANIDDFKNAEDALKKALTRSREFYGTNSLETANILSDLANYNHEIQNYTQAEDFILEALAIDSTINGPSSESIVSKFSIFASNQFLQSKYQTAKKYFHLADSLKQAYELTNTPGYYTLLGNLGETELYLGNYKKAEEHFFQVLNFYNNYYEREHINIAMTQYRLGLLYNRKSQYKKAETYLLKSLDGYKRALGENNSNLSATYAMLARNYRLVGDFKEAQYYAQKDADLTKNLFGDTSAMYAKSLNNLAMMQKAQGKFKDAKNNYQLSLSLYQKHLEKDNPDLAIPLYNLADVEMALGNYQKAHQLIKRVVKIDKNRLGPQHPEVGLDLNKMGAILTKAQKFSEANSVFEEAKSIFLEKLPKNHYRTGEYFVNYGILKLKQQNKTVAKEYFEKALNIFKSNFDEDHERIIETRKYLAKSNSN